MQDEGLTLAKLLAIRDSIPESPLSNKTVLIPSDRHWAPPKTDCDGNVTEPGHYFWTPKPAYEEIVRLLRSSGVRVLLNEYVPETDKDGKPAIFAIAEAKPIERLSQSFSFEPISCGWMKMDFEEPKKKKGRGLSKRERNRLKRKAKQKSQKRRKR